jgi:hypothetical protein
MPSHYAARDFRVNVPERIQGSARAAEEGLALGEEVAIGLEVVGARHVDAPALKALQAMLKHRPVDFFQHVEAHGDLEVGRDADEVAVEGGVVELAEREAVSGNAKLPTCGN